MEIPGIGEPPVYDCVVIGLGAHGAATVAALANSGHKVLGIDRQSTSPHRYGSSHGQSRIIRLAYFEDPTYVSLLKRSLELWKELSHQSPTPLLHLTGGLMMGKPESTVIVGTLASIQAHNLPHEILTAEDIRRRYPSVFMPDDDDIGLFEETAGYLIPELCISAFLTGAIDHGATLRFGETVCGWSKQSNGGHHYEVYTTAGEDKKMTYIAKKVVIAAGAWMPQLLAPLSAVLPPLHVVRRVQYWYRPLERQHDELFSRIPIYIWDQGAAGGGSFYGFPLQQGTGGVKVALHQLSDPDLSSQICDPDTIDRVVSDEEKHVMRTLLQRRIPLLGDAELAETETCMYTMTPNEHFLLDFHPDFKNDVVIVSACSGHGFKFATVIGEIVCDLITKEQTVHDVSLFSIERHRAFRE
jgi:sarcosine oxidase